jgi:hypothetical protein
MVIGGNVIMTNETQEGTENLNNDGITITDVQSWPIYVNGLLKEKDARWLHAEEVARDDRSAPYGQGIGRLFAAACKDEGARSTFSSSLPFEGFLPSMRALIRTGYVPEHGRITANTEDIIGIPSETHSKLGVEKGIPLVVTLHGGAANITEYLANGIVLPGLARYAAEGKHKLDYMDSPYAPKVLGGHYEWSNAAVFVPQLFFDRLLGGYLPDGSKTDVVSFQDALHNDVPDNPFQRYAIADTLENAIGVKVGSRPVREFLDSSNGKVTDSQIVRYVGSGTDATTFVEKLEGSFRNGRVQLEHPIFSHPGFQKWADRELHAGKGIGYLVSMGSNRTLEGGVNLNQHNRIVRVSPKGGGR